MAFAPEVSATHSNRQRKQPKPIRFMIDPPDPFYAIKKGAASGKEALRFPFSGLHLDEGLSLNCVSSNCMAGGLGGG